MEFFMEDLRKSAQSWSGFVPSSFRRVQCELAAASERLLHPWLRIPLLAMVDATYCALFGTAGLAICLMGCMFVFLLGMVMLAPPLTVLYWLRPLFPPYSSSSPHVQYLGALVALGSLTLFCMLSYMDERVKEDPRSNVLDFWTSFVKPLPMLLQVVCVYGFISLFTACCAVFTFDVSLGFYWSFYAILNFLYFSYRLIVNIPWYGLLLATLLVPVLVISLFRWIKLPKSEEDERQLVRRGLPV